MVITASGPRDERPHVQGRPCLLTKEVEDILIEGLSKGLNTKDACAIAGIGYSTFRAWRQKSYEDHPEHDPIYTNFFIRLRAAEVSLKEKCLNTIRKAIDEGDANIALKVLERKWRKEWSTQANVTLSGDSENPIVTKVIAFDPKAFPSPPTSEEEKDDD